LTERARETIVALGARRREAAATPTRHLMAGIDHRAEGGRMHGSGRPLVTAWLAIVVVVGLAACGATRSSADRPAGAGGLVPSIEDKEAGLVAIAPGLDLKVYRSIVVELFPVTDPPDDEGDRRFGAEMAKYFNAQLLRRLRDSGLFPQVVSAEETPTASEAGPALRLQGAITRLGRGSQAARYFAGIYGAGRARAQADMRFVEMPSGRVVIVTADRRVASMGFFGGSDRDHLEESFDDMARDLARFLVRLSKGEAPGK
jgi:hypothetical protein